MSALISLFNYAQILFLLKAIKGGFSKRSCRFDLIDAIYQYIRDCYKKSDIDLQAVDYFINLTYDKNAEILSNITDSFHILKEEVEFILKKHKKAIGHIHFDILPFVGLIICPQSRFVAAFSCSHEIDPARPESYSNEWYYYRINSY